MMYVGHIWKKHSSKCTSLYFPSLDISDQMNIFTKMKFIFISSLRAEKQLHN